MADETIDQEEKDRKKAKARTEQTLLLCNQMYEDVLMAIHKMPARMVNEIVEKMLEMKTILLAIKRELDELEDLEQQKKLITKPEGE